MRLYLQYVMFFSASWLMWHHRNYILTQSSIVISPLFLFYQILIACICLATEWSFIESFFFIFYDWDVHLFFSCLVDLKTLSFADVVFIRAVVHTSLSLFCAAEIMSTSTRRVAVERDESYSTMSILWFIGWILLSSPDFLL